MAPAGLVETFVGAIQASVSVLLVMTYGGVAAWMRLLDRGTTTAVSKICVRLFLPALLVTKIGAQLHADSAARYLAILLWAAACHLASYLVGAFGRRVLRMPDWTTVALMFNNTTSYPLLLISALEETGILASLTGAGESTSDAVDRAKAYFLVFSTVCNCLTFAVGPRLIDTEAAPSSGQDGDEDDDNNDRENENDGESEDDEESAIGNERTDALGRGGHGHEEEEPDEQSALLGTAPDAQFAALHGNHLHAASQQKGADPDSAKTPPEPCPWFLPKKRWRRCGARSRWWLRFLTDFFNAPFLGALAGAVIGLVPPLHRAFFRDTRDGGLFTAWLTASLKTVGELFVALPVVVAGVSLYTAMREARASGRGADGMTLPWATVAYVLAARFVLWPLASVGIVYLLASRTRVLGADPMLWFTMMMMPTGPPAMKLIAMVEASGAEKEDESSIAKLLTMSYLVSPILSFTVVGSLRASQAAMGG